MMTTKYSFEVEFAELAREPDLYVSSVFACLESEFLVMPKGKGFVEFSEFERGYEALKQATSAFAAMSPDNLAAAVAKVPISLIVLRSVLGFTPSEWAYVTFQRTGTEVSQGFARALDRRIRLSPSSTRKTGVPDGRLRAMLEVASQLLIQGSPSVPSDSLHRLDKADTTLGGPSIQSVAGMGVPYAMLLYERYLGRPFAGHRDSVSELVGDVLESAIEDVLVGAGISYRKTKRAERIPGFDQVPDFIIPSEFNPQVVIEAEVTEDDGTARDKVTRIQHLAELSLPGQPPSQPRYEVIACIGGRGFGVRREDMKKTLLATRGKVFTLRTLDRLVDCSRLRDFRTK